MKVLETLSIQMMVTKTNHYIINRKKNEKLYECADPFFLLLNHPLFNIGIIQYIIGNLYVYIKEKKVSCRFLY